MKSPPASACLLGILLSVCCSAQQNKLIVHPPDAATVKRGAAFSETLDVGVLPGFHVNSDKPKDEYLIPLKLTWNGGPLQSQDITYPKPQEITVGGQPTLVFTGQFHITTRFAAPADAPAGPAVVTGRLRYQACNDQMCFKPSSTEVRLPVTIR